MMLITLETWNLQFTFLLISTSSKLCLQISRWRNAVFLEHRLIEEVSQALDESYVMIKGNVLQKAFKDF